MFNMNIGLSLKINESSKTAEEFVHLYYSSVDAKRHQISRLYMDNATAIWNGNGISGNENIQQFVQRLPNTKHMIECINAQPIIDESIPSQEMILIVVSGIYRLHNDMAGRPFQQMFTLYAQGDKWKIAIDNFRIQDAQWSM
ncbi:NTF2-related export protein-like [Contarinia nasturtii]|uniref:NTF2-related export protein-like n=1 Tax=Contarinia nasturtii TaxID=265458 RepID=UPI0012D4B5E8|nr:NTF2-related export protein-like [Contarinia nasturtii]